MLRLDTDDSVLLDTCGTGGDSSGTVNISTLASFIIAACGVKVAKHGNRALSSRSGSHDVIETMGIDPAPTPETARRCLAEAGLCFMFAPSFHAATRHVAGPRRELGFRTLFNLLGPLTNPAGARYHMNGVFSAERCEFLARAHAKLGSLGALVVHGAGGLDEIATAGPTQVAELRDGDVRCYEIWPADFGLPEQDPAGLAGGDAATNARLLEAALAGAPGAIRVAALMEAAAGLTVVRAASDLRAGAGQAAAALDSGKARALVERLRSLSPVQKKE
jgi:anthranilate phosphoribosyltransferase